MKRLNESALKNMIRKLRQTGVVREPKMTRGRRCARVEVGDIVMSRMFARGYRQGDVTVVGTDSRDAGARVAFNPLRARANYVVESVQEETAGTLVDSPAPIPHRLLSEGQQVFRCLILKTPRPAETARAL